MESRKVKQTGMSMTLALDNIEASGLCQVAAGMFKAIEARCFLPGPLTEIDDRDEES